MQLHLTAIVIRKDRQYLATCIKDISLLKNESLIRIENLTNGAFTLHSQTY